MGGGIDFAMLKDQSKRFEICGKIAWLWMNSPLHDSWTMDLAARFILPAIATKQYLLIERDGMPVAYCSWAFLNKSSEVKYMLDASNISVEDWVGGDRMWFVDWVAPFNKRDSVLMKNELIKKFPYALARAIRVKKDEKNARVMEFKGRKLDSIHAKFLLVNYYQDFISSV
jgi:cytolysin-activating lysine-acyltransferase